jgi:hypothetical protein
MPAQPAPAPVPIAAQHMMSTSVPAQANVVAPPAPVQHPQPMQVPPE